MRTGQAGWCLASMIASRSAMNGDEASGGTPSIWCDFGRRSRAAKTERGPPCGRSPVVDRISSAALLLDDVLEGLRDRELDHRLGRDLDALAGHRVAAHARLA